MLMALSVKGLLARRLPDSPVCSLGSQTDEACGLTTPNGSGMDSSAALEAARRYAAERDLLQQRVADIGVTIGDQSNKTRLLERLGGGTFGEVYLGESIENGARVAVKIELNSFGSGRQQLLNEGNVYRKLAGGPGIPEVSWFGMHGQEFNALVMEVLGPTLYGVWSALGERFSVKTLLMVIDQTLETVAHVHRNGFVHRDISPSNFLLNYPSATRIQLIDFGQAKRISSGPFVQAVTARRKFSFARPVVGTPRFASCWSHAGVDAAYRDDMESLGFLWIYLARGRLPWQGIRDYAGLAKITRIGQIKATEPIEQLCAGLPDEFAVYMNYVRSLRPFDLPDHDGLRDLFRSLADQLGVGSYDWVFDWIDQSSDADPPITADVSKTFFLPDKGSAASSSKPNSKPVSDTNGVIHLRNVNDDNSGDQDGDENSEQSTTPVSK